MENTAIRFNLLGEYAWISITPDGFNYYEQLYNQEQPIANVPTAIVEYFIRNF